METRLQKQIIIKKRNMIQLFYRHSIRQNIKTRYFVSFWLGL